MEPDNAPRHIQETRRYIQDFIRLDDETRIAPRSSGKENHLKNVKPFTETLRVTNPVRQSRASSREASLAWGRATVTAKRRQRDQTLCD
jgi:hypothetical protein